MKKVYLLVWCVGFTLSLLTPLFAQAREEPATVWEDQFDQFDLDKWTTQFTGAKISRQDIPPGVLVRDSILFLKGVRLTSCQKFLYGTLEARVKIKPVGAQYFGFMSRAPWGENSAYLMSEPGGWHTIVRREDYPEGSPYAGIYLTVPEEAWYTIRIEWKADRLSVYLDGRLVGEIKDDPRIPKVPIPLIMDIGQPDITMEIDWIRVTGSTYRDGEVLLPLPPPPSETTIVLENQDWKVVIDPSSGIVHKIYSLRPKIQAWTPEKTRGIDLYIKDFPAGEPVRFISQQTPSERAIRDKDFLECFLIPEGGPFKDKVRADFKVSVERELLSISAEITSLSEINQPVEIGLGLPFRPSDWERQIFPRLPWLILPSKETTSLRLLYLSDPDDLTVASATGGWNFYPFGILEGKDRSVLWGNLDLGKRLVLSPGNYGSVPAITLAPKDWPKGKRFKLELIMRSFPGFQEKQFYKILRWYLSHCQSSDPLTRDLFPVRDWTPRVFKNGGGVGMSDTRITRVNPSGDHSSGDRVHHFFSQYNLSNLWGITNLAIDGRYPVAGSWLNVYGMPISAESLRNEIARLKGLGLRPCFYTFQWIVPELLKEGGTPDKNWIAYDSKGKVPIWASVGAGEGVVGWEWFTKELAEKIGSEKITWAWGDFGNEAFRTWYTEEIKKTVDYYQPSGLSFDWSWAGCWPYSTYSRANPNSSLPAGMLRAQAEIVSWMRERYPETQVIVNDTGGSPSNLLANCVLLESTEKMSDIDFLAVKALGSAMSSMNYFSDHDRHRWTRQAMLDLARGCSIGLPSWITVTPPESDYLPTWKKFFDFSGRTTRLPALPDEDAVTCISGQSEIVGTVWSDGQELMAAAFDRRTEGSVSQITISVKVPNQLRKGKEWSVTRLNRLNMEVPQSPLAEYNWKIEGFKGDRLILSGPLGPGEMVLIESAF